MRVTLVASDVDLFGESFRLVDDPADMEFAFLEFAEVASSVDAEGTAGAAAVMHLLEAALHPDDWQRFKQCCRKNKARTERDLMPIVVKAAEARTGRPTQQPSDSSERLLPAEQSSTAGSSSPVMDRLSGRPDLQLLVRQAQEQQVRQVG